MKKIIYMDHAATTPVSYEAMVEMLPYYEEYYGNPSSLYEFADVSKQAVNKAREQIADIIGGAPSEIYFTSGGTEADNWALRSVMEKNAPQKKHLIISQIEHPAVLNTAEYLKKIGYEVTKIKVNKWGRVDLDQLKSEIRKDTALVSIMFANNEIGTIEPIKEIAKITHEKGILFHTDGVQVLGQIPVNQKKYGYDLFSASAHKLGGPKGIGFLYIRDKCVDTPLIYGGGQERGIRAGTENVPGIIGFGKACEIAKRDMDEKRKKVTFLRDYFIREITRAFENVTINGSMEYRLPGNINVSFSNYSSSAILLKLDEYGICASGGSACTSRKQKKSHVLKSIGASEKEIDGAVRFTLGAENTLEEMDYLIRVLKNEMK